MRSASRGILAVAGFAVGFLTLVFLFQFNRHLTLGLAGDQVSLGMAAMYAVMTYTGATLTLLAFKPSVSLAKYLSGAGAAVTGVFILAAVYLFVLGDIASGMMVLIIGGGQAAVAGVVYAVARARSGDESDSGTTPVEPEPEPDPGTSSERVDDRPEPTPDPDPGSETPDTHPGPDPSESSRDIDWARGAQVFTGVVVFLIGIPTTVASPVGVPILVLGLALIPRVRSWSMRTLGRSGTSAD